MSRFLWFTMYNGWLGGGPVPPTENPATLPAAHRTCLSHHALFK